MNLGAADHLALRSAGFTPLGPASGSSVFTKSAPPPCEGDRDEFVADEAEVWLRRQGWTTALTRLREHCARVGGDGVIGVRLSQQRLGSRVEFTASGTAVRTDGSEYAEQPFTAHLDDAEFAALLSAGWVPVGVALGVAAVRGHIPLGLPRISELPEHTKALRKAMSLARQALHDDALRHGPDGVVVHEVTSDVGLDECRRLFEDRNDVEASVVIVGTAIAQFRRTDRPPLTVMPLHRGGTR